MKTECEGNAKGKREGNASRMQGECEPNATAKARGQGGGGRGQRGRGEQPSQRRKRALAHNTTQQHETTLKPPRLFPFAPFGEGSDPLAPCPDPLPPASLLYRLHRLASPCIGLHPLAPLCIPLASVFICSTFLGVSGCRGVWTALGVGVSGRLGCQGVGSGCRLSPCPCPCSLPQDKESGVSKTLLSFHSLFNLQLMTANRVTSNK